MFRLHDSTRRRVSLTAFLLLCVLPTVIVLAWGIARRLPGHVRSEAERLSTHLGVKVTLTGLRHPRPGVVVYEGLDLADPETQQLMLRCQELEAAWKEPAEEEDRSQPVLVLRASEPVIEEAELNQLWKLLRRVLTCRGGWQEIDVRATAGGLTLGSGENSATLTDLEGRIDTFSTGVQAEVAFRLAGVEMPQAARIRITRNRQFQPPTTGFALHTGGAALPCPLLATALPNLQALGPESCFRGYLWVNETPDGTEGELTGQFIDVDLETLATDRVEHSLSGTGQLTIQNARFHNRRLQQASGSLEAGPGVIGRSLLEASSQWLGMARNADSAALGDPVPYQRLAISFLIDSGGLQLRGQCPGARPGAVVTSRYGPLLVESISHPQPVAALVGALVPPGEILVPAAGQAEWLISHLPTATRQ